MKIHRSWRFLALILVLLFNILFILPATLLVQNDVIPSELRLFILFISTTVTIIALYYLLYTRITYTQ